MNMSKKERIFLRVTSDKKELWEQRAKKQGLTLTELITYRMDNCETIAPKTHEQNVVDSMKENYLINTFLQSLDLSDKTKNIIVKEMKKYV